ncbi:uroporphyrin-III C-methyltransferase, partial [Spiromyces aspiralis]
APKLANRIRRHIAGGLPRGTGDAVEKIGMLRQMIRQMDPEPESSKRRMAWLSQLCEYWPMEQLAKLDQEDYQKLLDAYMENTDPRCVSIGDKADYPAKVAAPITLTAVTVATDAAVSLTDSGCEETLPSTPESASTKEGGGISQNASASSSITTFSTANTNNHTGNNGLGSITLVGAGLGDPDLLTVKAKRALTTADYVISDKLIPSPILELVPESAELYIARKFPGMANAAQHDIINRALEQLRQGKRVVRLKQGDPFVYGRGGEEVLEFRQHGYEPEVVPGLSSALS